MSAPRDPGRYRRVLMTGGTGFVGATFCPDLVVAFADAERLMIVRRGDPAKRSGFDMVDTDLLNPEALGRIVKDFRPDLVLHLAAQASVGQLARGTEQTWRINAEATLNLAAAVARHAPASTFFFVSSGEVYGLRFKEGPADETVRPEPMNAYARSKLAAEMMLGDVLPGETRLVVVRPFNHTGPGQDSRFVLPAFAAQIAEIETGRASATLHVGDLDAERDFLDVRDVSRAYIGLLDAELGPRSVFNIASGEARRVGDLLDMLRALSGTRFEITIDKDRLRPSEVRRVVGSSARLKALTGWTPQIPIGETLQSVLDFQRRQISLQGARA